VDAPADEPTVAEILARAAEAGLALTEAEARELQTGVRRVRAMAAAVRGLIGPEVEPSGAQVRHPVPGRRS